jgi:acyl dehydratase
MKYLEDLVPGTVSRFGNKLVTREEVIDFAARYDPQPFHLDDAAAAKTYFGRLSASGWHTCAMLMRMMVDNMARDGHAGLGSPGLDELRWLKPVYPGDTLRVESVLDEVRPSRSKPDMGSVHSTVTVFNQHDEPVMRMKSIGLVRRRPGGDQ